MLFRSNDTATTEIYTQAYTFPTRRSSDLISRTVLAKGLDAGTAFEILSIDIADVDGLRAEAEDAAASGFQATACIHPSQVAVIRGAYAPTAEERAWAERLLDEATRQSGVFRFEGRMIDEPILRQARELVR